MKRLAIAIALIVSIPGVASAGGGGGDISQCRGFATGTSISMLDSCFDAFAHSAPTDAAITISNDGFLPHSFTAVDGSFDSGTLEPGQDFELIVDEPGIYQVFCTLHGTAEGAGMAGVLVVGEPEPGPIAATLDTSAIREAVAEENRAVADALNRQAQTIGDLRATQAELKVSLERGVADASAAPQAPIVVTAPDQPDSQPIWVMVGVGLAGGLALAALLTALLRPRLREGPG